MLTVLLHSLRRSVGRILGWGLSLALLGYFLFSFYDTFAAQQTSLNALLAQYPPELMAFFGDMTQMFTPQGFLTVEFFSYMPLVLGVFAVLAGSGLVVSDEENGTLDLIMAHPVSRTGLFLGRLLAFILSLAAILGITWLAFIAGASQSTGLDLSALELLRPFLSLFAVLLLFGALSLLLSFLLPSRSLAAMVGGLILVASYFIQALSGINDDLKEVAEFLPLRYYQSGDALSGLNAGWLAALLGIAILFILLAASLFQRRDIRVSGEGSWRLGFLRRRQPAAVEGKS